MKSLLILFFLSFSFLSTYAQAGHDKGNGAYGLSCLSYDNTPMSFLYDVVEANKIYDLTIYAPKGQDTPFLIALAYIEGLKKLDPVRYEKYKK